MPSHDEEFFCAGVVTGTHGLRGDLKVKPLSGEPDVLLSSEQIRLVAPGQPDREHRVLSKRLHKDRVLLRLEGLEHLNQVERLKGAEIHCRIADLPDLEDEDFYWYQIQGMQVVDRTLGDLGTLESYFTTAAHDTWVVQGPYGEVLIPAVDKFFVSIDPEAGLVTVDLPEGLVEAEDS